MRRPWKLTPLGWAVVILTGGAALLFRPYTEKFPLNKTGVFERSKNFRR